MHSPKNWGTEGFDGAGRGRSRETRQNAWQASNPTHDSVRSPGLHTARETTATQEPAIDGWDDWADLTGMAPQGSNIHDVRGDQQSAEPQATDADSSSSSLHGDEVDFITGQRYSQAQVSSHVLGVQAASPGWIYASAPAQPSQSSMMVVASLPRQLRRLGEGLMHPCGMQLPSGMVLLHSLGGGCQGVGRNSFIGRRRPGPRGGAPGR